MSEQQRIECPAKLFEQLKWRQLQIDKLVGEIQAAVFGAQVALNIADDWQWDGAGWRAPEQESPPVTTAG